jgi:predicted metal-dependent peptidase
MNDTEKKDKITTIATDILILSKDDLSMTMHFLTIAFNRLSLACIPELRGMATDGNRFFFDPSFVLSVYKTDKNTPARIYLHSIIHCLLQHPFRTKDKDEELWNVCTDIATENIILEMNLPTSDALNDKRKESLLVDFRKKLGLITAEKLYAHFIETKVRSEEMSSVAELFSVDLHRFWMKDINIKKEIFKGDTALPTSPKDLAVEWDNIIKMSRTRLKASQNDPPEIIYHLLEDVSPKERKKKSYSEFLKRFIVIDEEIKVSLDEFDYGLYTYGLNLYRNMPLIEPLEYKESEKIKEFVIAIDTSGSCQGKPVREFLHRTYDIMKSTEKFFRKTNFYIIQADDRIRSSVHITCDEDFDHYINNEKLTGFGDTDFRPVFRHVDQLVLSGALKNLKGLIYFTDGFGIFPEWAPVYDAIFVFLNENNNANSKLIPIMMINRFVCCLVKPSFFSKR